MATLGSWFPDPSGAPCVPRVLANPSLDLAVAHGAAIRLVTLALLGLPDAALPAFRAIGNCRWVDLESRSGTMRLAGYNLGPA